MNLFHQDSNCTIFNGDCREVLKTMAPCSVQCCVTSPPYWNLRDYKSEKQIGAETSFTDFIDELVGVFQLVKRVLRDDGTFWLNLGDTFNFGKSRGDKAVKNDVFCESDRQSRKRDSRLKAKDLIGIPWRVAFALQEDGWYLRSDIIWSKPNAMPESVTDRPTRSHEYIFLLSKSKSYYYDFEAIQEPCAESSVKQLSQDLENQNGSIRANGGLKTNGPMKAVASKQRGHSRRHAGFNDRWDNMERANQCSGMRNKRDVWTVAPACFNGAHFATFPPDLIKPCILAGTKPGDIVLDPFLGSGTTAMVASELGRKSIGIELNPDYCELAKSRINVTPGLAL